MLSVLFIAAMTACLPLLVEQSRKFLPQVTIHDSYNWLPALAAILFVIAFFIPDIHISKETTTFQQHLVGGGIYCALLYLYFQKLLGWKTNWVVSVLLLFAWTSTFGVANELLEFTLTKLNIAQIGTGDTDWDLLANTLGSLLSYGAFLACMRIFGRHNKQLDSSP